MGRIQPFYSGTRVYFLDANSNRRVTQGWRCHGSGWFPVLLWFFLPASSQGAELDMFRLTDIEGSLELGYSVKDLEVKRLQEPSKTQRRTVNEQELKLESKGYIYHPNLVDMVLGAGVRFRNDEYETDTGSNEGKNELYSFNSSFDILKAKPYPLKLYFNQSNPTSTTGLADSVTTENRNYGLVSSLLRPLVPFPLWFSARHSESKGKGGSSVIDSEYDYQQFRMSVDHLDNFNANISIDHSKTHSGSGSQNLPLQSTTRETLGFDYAGNVQFGENSRSYFNNVLSYDIVDIDDYDKRKDGRFYASLELHHGEAMKSFYRYDIQDTSYTDSDVESAYETLTAGVVRDFTENLTFNGTLDASDEDSRGFKKSSYGANSTFRYINELSEDTPYTTTYSLDYKRNRQESELNQVTRIDEQHLLADLQPVMLDNEFVIPGSVVVRNADRTQTYVEGLDYMLTVIGSETRLERLLGGNIPDGETVLVDYTHETGGTFEYGALRQSLSGGISFYNTYQLYANYTRNDERLEDGRPLRPLYSRERAMASARGRHRLSTTKGFTWHLEITKQTGELRPYLRKLAEISFTTALPVFTSFAKWHSRYENVDNKLSEEDTNLTLHGLTLFARTGYRSGINLDYSVEKDTGGTLTREVKRGRLSYNWALRLLSFSLNGQYQLEEQGDVSRKDSTIELRLIRKL